VLGFVAYVSISDMLIEGVSVKNRCKGNIFKKLQVLLLFQKQNHGFYD
jgi:hypothetical protein